MTGLSGGVPNRLDSADGIECALEVPDIVRAFPIAATLCLGIYLRTVVCAQPPELIYQDRTSYSEGTRTIPSTGKATLDLIAALIQHQEPPAKLPPKFRAMFYRPTGEAPSLSIREVEPLYFYQLGDVSNSSWKGQPIVHYEWPTETVVARLTYKKDPLRLDRVAYRGDARGRGAGAGTGQLRRRSGDYSCHVEVPTAGRCLVRPGQSHGADWGTLG